MAGFKKEIQVHMVRRIPLCELPFLISFGIYMFFGILTQTMYYQYFSGSLYRLILGGCVLILAFQELIFSRDWLRLPVREIGGGLLCLLAAAYTWKIADGNMLQRSVAFLFLYLFCARNVEYLHIAEVSRIVSWIVLVLVVVSAKLGVIENFYLEINGRTRQCLGFRYTLLPPAILCNILMLTILIRKESIWISELVLFLVLSVWMYVVTQSRLSVLMNLVLLAVAALYRLGMGRVERHRILSWMMAFSFVILAGLCIWATFAYNEKTAWMRSLDGLLNHRLYYGRQSLDLYGVSLFGQKIEWVGAGLDQNGQMISGRYLYVDCFYVMILQRYGILFTVLLLAALTLTAAMAVRRGDRYLLLVLFFMALHCVLDDLFLYPFYNSLWFAMALVFGSGIRLPERRRSVPAGRQTVNGGTV